MLKELLFIDIDNNVVLRFDHFDYLNLMDYDSPFIVDYDIFISYDDDVSQTKITGEIGDFMELSRRLKRILGHHIESCNFNPILEDRFNIQFNMVENHIKLNVELYDLLYENKLESNFSMGEEQIRYVITQIDTSFPPAKGLSIGERETLI